MPSSPSASVVFGSGPASLGDALAVVRGAPLALAAGVEARLSAGVALFEQHLARGTAIYGVTTGFGASVDTAIPLAERAALVRNLVAFHGCGTGRPFDPAETRAILVARLCSLVLGHSAVRYEVVQRLAELLNRNVLPVIPSEGSVGASGDLTPLSYVAAVLMGDREVLFRGQVSPARDALSQLGLAPLELGPKESLALMNGTSVMTGLALLAFERTLALCRWSAWLTAVCSEVVRGQPGHFDERLFELKPHLGQVVFARWVRAELGTPAAHGPVLQDRYSLRCAPHVVGVALDELVLHQATLETELNSVNDNPIVDGETGRILHGGHFYGGHVCLLMDSLKTCVANVADLMDRQLVLLGDPVTSRGLPANLVAPSVSGAHHGFKAMQITASALVAEACKLSVPASVFSRSTENHNQDKVSLGTIAARDCLRVLELAETVAAIHSLALAQACDLRAETNGPGAARLLREVRTHVPMNTADRRMDLDVQLLLRCYRERALTLGDMRPIDLVADT